MNSVIERLQHQLAKRALPDESWNEFLDEIRTCSEKLEQEITFLRADREQLLAILNLVPVAFFVKDRNSRFFLMNLACEEQWGLSLQDLRDTDASKFFPPDQIKQFFAMDQAIFEGRKAVEFEETIWNSAKQCNRICYTFKRPMYDEKGEPLYLVCVTLDITDRKLSDSALLDSETRLREAITHSPNAMMMHADDGNIIMASNALAAITGYKLEDLPTISVWAEKAYGIHADSMRAKIRALFELNTVRHEGESTIITASGEKRIWEIMSQPLPKLPDGRRVLLSSGVDITEHKRMEKELLALATTDALTNLPNRRQFLAKLEDEIVRMQRLGNYCSSILMLDLDFFKLINDTYGHNTGDEVLKHFAQLMSRNLRSIDTGARIGGEEFAVILPGLDLASAQQVAERLCEALTKTPFVQKEARIPITVSVGVATLDPGDPNADSALLRADKALYLAKNSGRNRVELAEARSVVDQFAA